MAKLTPTQIYQRLYKASQGVFYRDLFMTKILLEAHFAPLYTDELKALFHKKYPRRKVFRIELLSEEEVAPINKKWQKIALEALRRNDIKHALILKYLEHYAPMVDMTPQSQESVVATSDSGTYWSQGYGASRYARAALQEAVPFLEEAGFTARIESEPAFGTMEKSTFNGIASLVFKLWSNAAPWQLDALRRRSQQSELEWAKNCWRNGVNPSVYNPFLPHEVWDESINTYRT